MRATDVAVELVEVFLRGVNREATELAGAGRRWRRYDSTTLDRLIEGGARLMWVAAHPDDESFAGPILAKAGLRCGNGLYFLVLTRGEGGECLLPGGPVPDLGAVRSRELARVAELYGAELQVEPLFNASLPVESFPRRHEIARLWREVTDPAVVVARAIRSFRPDVVLTFAPDYGSTGHPEHQLASRFATAGIRLAATSTRTLPGRAHRVENTYYLLNRYWYTRLLGMGQDPLPYTEVFEARQPCVPGHTCADIMGEFTRPHLTQAADMGMMRKVARIIRYLYLYRADPFTEIKDPYEFHPVRGMG